MSIACDFEGANARHDTDPDPRRDELAAQGQTAPDETMRPKGRISAPQPRVSVIIPTYNREHFVQDAIHSILAQTFGDFEVIVVDDGSSDATASAVRAIKDVRVRLVQHARNRGIPQARNTGLDEARGEYIAWLDSDDIARPGRLETQVRFLVDHPDVAMVGCCAGKFGRDGRPLRGVRVPPLAPADIRAWLLFRSAFQQSSLTGRAEILKLHRYREEFEVCEDIDVFIRLDEVHPILNLPQILIDRRIHEDQAVRLLRDAIQKRSTALFADRLDRLGIAFSDDDLHRHVLLSAPHLLRFLPDRDFLRWSEAWLLRLRAANADSGYTSAAAMRLATSYFWTLACHAAVPRLGRGGAVLTFGASTLMPALLSGHSRKWLGHVLSLHVSGLAAA